MNGNSRHDGSGAGARNDNSRPFGKRSRGQARSQPSKRELRSLLRMKVLLALGRMNDV